jgi:hypothetical protein
VAPLFAQALGGLDGEGRPDGQLYRTRQDVRGQRIRVEKEPDLDPVQLRPTQDVPIVRFEDQVGASHELANLERTQPDELGRPVRMVEEVRFVLDVRPLEQVLRNQRPPAEQRIRVDIRLLPFNSDRA